MKIEPRFPARLNLNKDVKHSKYLKQIAKTIDKEESKNYDAYRNDLSLSHMIDEFVK